MADILEFPGSSEQARNVDREVQRKILVGPDPFADSAAPAVQEVAPGSVPAIEYGVAQAFHVPASKSAPDVVVRTTASGHARMRITVESEQVSSQLRDARAQMAQLAQVDANDVAAMSQLRNYMGAEAYDQALGSMAQGVWSALAATAAGLHTVLDPVFLSASAPEVGRPYSFDVDVLLRPPAQLDSYGPVSVEVAKPEEVSSKDVSALLDDMAQSMTTYEPVLSGKAVAEGDVVDMTLTPIVNGAEQAQGLNLRYMVGTPTLGQDVDQNVRGMHAGETRTFAADLPLQSAPGVDASEIARTEVKVEIVQLLRVVTPKIDDAWVSRNVPGLGTLLELRAQVRRSLEEEAKQHAEEETQTRALDELVKRLKTSVPQDYALRAAASMKDRVRAGLVQQGIADPDLFFESDSPEAKALRDQIDQDAADVVKKQFALGALADHLNIQADTHASLLSQADEERTLKAMQWLSSTAKDSSGPHLELV